MAALADGLRFPSGKHLDNVIQPKAEPALRLDSMNARKKFLRRHGAVECLPRSETVIAAVARSLFESFAKILQQRHPTALARFGVMHHLAQLLTGDALFFFA